MTRDSDQSAKAAAAIDVDSLIAQFRMELAAHAPAGRKPDDGLGIDELMRRLDVELGLPAAPGALRNAAAWPTWTPGQPELPLRKAYAVSELLQFDDAQFIETAYRIVLKRMPDPEGREFYLGRLRRGDASRIGVLAALRWSPEGVARGVHVDGLLLPYLLERWQRWPMVGPVIGWLRGLARLHTLAFRLETLRQAQAREWQQLGEVHNQLVETASRHVDELRAAGERGELQLNVLQQQVQACEAEVGRLQQEVQALQSRHADAQATIATMEHRLLEQAATEAAQQQQVEADATRQRALDPLYSRFEDRFRGAQEDIRKRVEGYLDLVRRPGIGDADSPIVDVGSGRGEWLDVLRSAGLNAFGIDNNETFVGLCRARGLAVTEGDALAALASLPDASAGAVTSMHLAEHLPFELLVQLIDQAQRILRPGGLLLLETPNPENLNVGAHWFYLDPTHRNPLPPAMLSWLVEERGFSGVEVLRLSEHRDFHPPDLMDEDAAGAVQVNEMLAGFRAAPDYAVVAWRR